MTKNRTPTPVYLDPGMHSGLELKGIYMFYAWAARLKIPISPRSQYFAGYDNHYTAMSIIGCG